MLTTGKLRDKDIIKMNGIAAEKIKIGINGSMLDDRPTGVGVYSFNLINNLTATHQCTNSTKIFTVFTPTRLFLNRSIHIKKLPGLLKSSKYGKLAAFSRFVWNTFYYPFYARKYSLLISPTTHGSFLSKNQIITIHDLISLRFNNISFHQRFYFKYLLPFLINRAKLIIAVSEATKKDIMQFFSVPEEKISVVYNGYDNNKYFPAVQNRKFIFDEYGVKDYILAVGPTYPHKNFEMLINAYSCLSGSIQEQHPMLIAGGKPKYIAMLKELVCKLGLQKSIIFAGYVSGRLMAPLYREAHLLVFPSLYEGFGIPLLEAMACGCPVIVSNTASMPEVCGNAVVYIDPLEKQSLVNAMESVVNDNGLREELKERGLIQAGKFSWQQMAAAFNTIIEASLTNHKI